MSDTTDAAPAPTEPTASATDPAAELAHARAEAEKWKGHARDWEKRAKENSGARDEAEKNRTALMTLAKELGIVEDKPDPEAVSRQLAAVTAERTQLARERAVLMAAAANGADAGALLDSRSFLATLDGIDPADAGAVSAAVKAAVEGSDRYRLQQAAAAPTEPVTPPAPAPRQASSPGQFNGSPGAARQLTEADVRSMTGAQLSKAMKNGLLDDYFATPNG